VLRPRVRPEPEPELTLARRPGCDVRGEPDEAGPLHRGGHRGRPRDTLPPRRGADGGAGMRRHSPRIRRLAANAVRAAPHEARPALLLRLCSRDQAETLAVGCARCAYASWSRFVTWPTRPMPTGRPSTFVIGMT